MVPFLISLATSLVACGGAFLLVFRSVSRAEAADEERRGIVRDHPELGPYELAFLAGGPERVAETAIAAVVDSGRLRVSRDGTLHQVADAGLPVEPVERAVLDVVADRGGQARASDVRERVSRCPETAAVRTRLAGMGLHLSHEDQAFIRARIGGVRLRAAVTLLGAVVLGFAFVVTSAFLEQGPALLPAAASAVLLGIGLWGRRRARRLEARLTNRLTNAGVARLGAALAATDLLVYQTAVALHGVPAMDDGLGGAMSGRASMGGDFGSGGAGDFDTAGASCGGGCGGGGCGGCGG